jgi:hypothetical protein
MNGPDIELIPRPLASNKGRCVVSLDSAGDYSSIGSVGAEEGSTISGDIIFIDANNDEFELFAVGVNDTEIIEPSLNSYPPGNFFCLQYNESIVFRPSAPNPNQKGIFFPIYHDTDAIGLRVPVTGASEVLVVQAPPGKLVGFPSVKNPDVAIAPFATVGGDGMNTTLLSLYLEDVDGNRVKIIDLYPGPNTIEMSGLDAVLTLAPGEKIIAKPDQAPGGNLTIHTTIALLNAANEAR